MYPNPKSNIVVKVINSCRRNAVFLFFINEYEPRCFRFLRLWKEWRTSYLSGTAWMDWANEQMSKVK